MTVQTATPTGTVLWREVAQQLRVDSISATTQAGSGHPTSSMSAADLLAVLLAGQHFTYDFPNPQHPRNDHLILSKGHTEDYGPMFRAFYGKDPEIGPMLEHRGLASGEEK